MVHIKLDKAVCLAIFYVLTKPTLRSNIRTRKVKVLYSNEWTSNVSLIKKST